MHHMYLLLVKVALLDSWLLSKASNIRERVQGRHTKILWLVLLPLVLTLGKNIKEIELVSINQI